MRSLCGTLCVLSVGLLLLTGCAATNPNLAVSAAPSADWSAPPAVVEYRGTSPARAEPLPDLDRPVVAAAPQGHPIQGGSMEAGALVNFYIWDDVGDQGVDPSVGFGVRFGYYLTENHELELSWKMSSADVENGNSALANAWEVDYWYNFDTGGPLVPFAGAGVGYWTLGDDYDDDGLMVAAGGGVKYFFSENLLARLDVGIQQADTEADHGPDFRVELGVSYHFGGK